jgi:BirA family biotin operon repressor/biotin-[acetyl-CoA-carboxylase] ligase
MNPRALDALIDRLATGAAHRGEDLAQALGISRAAVWKKIEALRELGVEIEGRAGSGYALARPIERLHAAALRDAMAPATRAALRELRIVSVIDSTNAAWHLEAHRPRRRAAGQAQTVGEGVAGVRRPRVRGRILGSLFWRWARTGRSRQSAAVGIARWPKRSARGLELRVNGRTTWIDGQTRRPAGRGRQAGPSHVWSSSE